MLKKCEVDGCDSAVYGKGKRGSDISITKYCRRHYRWLKERGTLSPSSHSHGSVEDRFWRNITRFADVNACWEWKGTKLPKGYGVFSDEPPSVGVRGKTISAHRYSFVLHGGVLNEGDFVLHSCDNPQCTNPIHLRKGTQSENIKEAISKGRKFVPSAKGEQHPKSKLTEEQVRFIKSHPELGHKTIADMFGLSLNCIRGVRIGRTWTHIE